MRRFPAAAALAVWGAVLATGAMAQTRDLPLETFYGTFKGSGVAQNEDSLYFGTTARDFDVTIGPAGAGFKVAWTSVIRGGGDPKKPDVKRKSSERTFMPAARPGIYKTPGDPDPFKGDEVGWARISGNTLSVYLMMIRDDGRYEIQRYDRTLSDLGMQLQFTRVRDGDQVRIVKGRAVKTAR